MISNSKIYRITDVRLVEDERSLCITQQVIAKVRAGKLLLADGNGRLVPATRADLLAARQLRDHEIAKLLAAMKWSWQRAEREAEEETFTLAVPLPPISEFRSRSRGCSPLGSFMRWADQQAGQRMHPSDVLIHHEHATELRHELREWLRIAHRCRGERLRQAVNFHDFGGAPLATGQRSSLARGWAYLRARKERGP